MQLKTQEEQRYPVTPLSPLLNREAVEGANRWLARFAPLLDGLDTLGAAECRERLQRIESLQSDGHDVLQRLEEQATQTDMPLVETVRTSVTELDALESELRRRLSRLAPGDPEAHVDLTALQAKLAENAARREVGSWGTQDALLPPRLDLPTSPPRWGAAGMLALFSLGWNSFTTIHAVLFIGGFMKVMGLFALFFLLFYSLFWAVGIAMAWGAFMAACDEQISVEGRRLTLTRKLLGYTWRRDYTLMEGTRARLLQAAVQNSNRTPTTTHHDVAVTDEAGKEIRFASGRGREEQERIIRKLNEYLAAAQ